MWYTLVSYWLFVCVSRRRRHKNILQFFHTWYHESTYYTDHFFFSQNHSFALSGPKTWFSHCVLTDQNLLLKSLIIYFKCALASQKYLCNPYKLIHRVTKNVLHFSYLAKKKNISMDKYFVWCEGLLFGINNPALREIKCAPISQNYEETPL